LESGNSSFAPSICTRWVALKEKGKLLFE
jgi:hypothetical protein